MNSLGAADIRGPVNDSTPSLAGANRGDAFRWRVLGASATQIVNGVPASGKMIRLGPGNWMECQGIPSQCGITAPPRER